MVNITQNEFENLARLIVETAGIQVDKGKEYLMEARLLPIVERYGFNSFDDLYKQTITDTTGKLKASIIDAITINETYFFRDKAPFELLKNKIIPDIIDQKDLSQQSKLPLKIWSAACSTGQEVYSLGMMLDELFLGMDRVEINILGTDISNEAIAKASYGKYNKFEIERGLSPKYLGKYFEKLTNGWKIKDEIRAMARFSQMDLNRSFAGIGTFDIILCRNVAIYFPVDGKIKLFQKLATALKPNGVLLVGGSESLIGLANDFIPRHYLNSVFYQLRNSDPTKIEPPGLSPYRKAEDNIKIHSAKSPTISTSQDKPVYKGSYNKATLPKMEVKTPEIENKPNHPVSAPPQTRFVNTKVNDLKTLKKSSLLEKLHSKNKTKDSPLPIKKTGEKSQKNSLLEKIKAKNNKQ